HLGQRAQIRQLAGRAVEDSVLDGFERSPRFLAKTDAHGIRTTIRDQRIGCSDAVKNGRGVLGDFGRSEAEAAGDARVDLEIRGGAADRVFDAVLDIDHARNFADGVANAWTELRKQRRIADKNLDLNWLRRV